MSGEVRKLPPVRERVETGPVQFGDDWPGVFIRGDNAAGFALALKDLLIASPNEPSDPFSYMTLRGLLDILEASNVRS